MNSKSANVEGVCYYLGLVLEKVEKKKKRYLLDQIIMRQKICIYCQKRKLKTTCVESGFEIVSLNINIF